MSPWEKILKEFESQGLKIQTWFKPDRVAAYKPFHRNERLSAAYVASRLQYEPDTGHLRWKALPGVSPAERAWNGKFAGKIAGCKSGHNVQINLLVEGKQFGFRAHRIAWALMTGEWPDGLVDHKDGDTFNNKWANLRPSDHSSNGCNAAHMGGECPFKGVSPYGLGFRAQATRYGETWCVSGFRTPEQAADAYDRMATVLHGEFAKTNREMGLL